jgi:hypothetical protein
VGKSGTQRGGRRRRPLCIQRVQHTRSNPRGGDVPARRPRRASPDDSPDATQLIKIGAPIACPTCGSHTRTADTAEGWVPGRSVRVVLAGDAPPRRSPPGDSGPNAVAGQALGGSRTVRRTVRRTARRTGRRYWAADGVNCPAIGCRPGVAIAVAGSGGWPPSNAVVPLRQAASVTPSEGNRPLSSSMIMPWMNAHAARARSGRPRHERAAPRCGFPARAAAAPAATAARSSTGTRADARPRRPGRRPRTVRGSPAPSTAASSAAAASANPSEMISASNAALSGRCLYSDGPHTQLVGDPPHGDRVRALGLQHPAGRGHDLPGPRG